MLRRTWLQGWVVGTVRTLTGGAITRFLVAELSAVQTGPGSLYLNLSDYPDLQNPGGSVLIELSAVMAPLIVNRASLSQFYVLDSVCTHAGCTMGAFNAGNGFIQCPCHGSRYDIQGQVIRGPAVIGLTNFSVDFDGDSELKIAIPNLPLDVRPIQVLIRHGGGTRMKLSFRVRKGGHYEVRFQTDVQGPNELAAFSATPQGVTNLTHLVATSDGFRHVYVDATTKRGFYAVVEVE
ncbi:MAG: ubiquinol-cytochrome c reductase iron-sulfur subunit [Prosthecobacter sp.]|nr:ubiquinol-cytochrome c reductase iron-sulfur subunit [Prosthecobacter sp.]